MMNQVTPRNHSVCHVHICDEHMIQPHDGAASLGNETFTHDGQAFSENFKSGVCEHGTFSYMLVMFIVANLYLNCKFVKLKFCK